MTANISKKRKFVADGVFFAELNEFLTRELSEEGYSGVEVRVTPARTEIIIRATSTQKVLGEKGRRIRELTSVVQKRFNFPENTVELYAEKVNERGLCATAQAESLRFRLLQGLAVRRSVDGSEFGVGIWRRRDPEDELELDDLLRRSCKLFGRESGTLIWRNLCLTDYVPLFDRACYGVLRFIMESGAKGCEVVVSGKLRAARAKSMKFVDGFMIHSGQPTRDFIDSATRHVLLRQGVLGIKVKIMLDQDPTGKTGPKTPLPDTVTILEPKEEEPAPAPVAAPVEVQPAAVPTA
ncbi:40S ribosomal protein S3 [Borealophlyctis nickersoniae]|nr:40S ribosomal protein S3 [Borealophlyctis nickersoniae]